MKKAINFLQVLLISAININLFINKNFSCDFQEKVGENKIKKFKSVDKVDLTLSQFGSVEVVLSDLKNLLNSHRKPGVYSLRGSALRLININNDILNIKTSYFYDDILRILLAEKDIIFNKVTFSTSNRYFDTNYVTVYYSYLNFYDTEIRVINRFNWNAGMERFWTKKINFLFKLFY